MNLRKIYGDAKSFADELAFEYIETSAKNGENIDHVFYKIVNMLLEARCYGWNRNNMQIESNMDEKSVPLLSHERNDRKCCCSCIVL